MLNRVKDIISSIVNKENIYLVRRGNSAIKEALNFFNKDITLIQDQGGWVSYKQFPKRVEEVKTDYGVIDLDDLSKKANEDSVLLINSLAGYFAEQPMDKIMEICREKKCFVINDVSGSIGMKIAKAGDIIIGSFGEWKVIELGYGGFLASDYELNIKEDFDLHYLERLYKELMEIDSRLEFLRKINSKVKRDLKDFEILHKEHKGINVVVKYKDEGEKEKIIEYCKKNKFEFTECPIYIRANENAISIELKRLKDVKSS